MVDKSGPMGSLMVSKSLEDLMGGFTLYISCIPALINIHI